MGLDATRFHPRATTGGIMTVRDWTAAAAEVIDDWDTVLQWSDAGARHVQQVDDGRRAVELLRLALTRASAPEDRL
jgi:hypothetical protein